MARAVVFVVMMVIKPLFLWEPGAFSFFSQQAAPWSFLHLKEGRSLHDYIAFVLVGIEGR